MPDRVIVYDIKVAAEFRTGGQAWRFARMVREDIKNTARMEAPKRSNELASSHYAEAGAGNQFVVRGAVGNYAEYANFVHEGTTGPIFPNGEFLKIPIGAGFPPSRRESASGAQFAYRRSVRGQSGNPWLNRAAEKVLPRYL